MNRLRLRKPLPLALMMLCLATPALATGGGTAVCPPPIDFDKDVAGTDLYAGQPVDGLAGLLASGVTVSSGATGCSASGVAADSAAS